MNKMLIWAAIAIVVLGGGYFFATNMGTFTETDDAEVMMEKDAMEDAMEDAAMNDDAMMDKGEDAMMEEDSMMEKEDGAMMDKGGSYEVYAPEKLALANSGDVVLFFRATWCPTCKALAANIRSNLSGIPAGLTILDVDYDNSSALKQKYGVTYQHTLVQVRADGSMITKWNGSPARVALVAEVI